MTDPLINTSPTSSGSSFAIPTYELVVDNQKLEDQRGDVLSVRFSDAVKELSYAEIVLSNQSLKGGEKPGFKYSDGELFELGQRLELTMGYRDGPAVQKLIVGEITALEPSYTVGAGATFKVRAFDRLHRLRNQPKSRAWKKKTDTQIAEEIAQAHGVEVTTDDSQDSHELVPQHNQDDFAFLVERAKRIDFELYMRLDKLHFVQSKEGMDPELSLVWGQSLREFHPVETLARQVSSVRVRSWDPAEGKLINELAEGAALDARKRGGRHAAKTLEDALGRGKEEVITHQVAQGPKDAQRLAQAVLRRNSHNFITAWGECVGLPKLRAGTSVEIKNLGKRFSGVYYVTESTHTFDVQGYRTTFRARRAFA